MTISGTEDVKTDKAPKLTGAQIADVVKRLAAYDSPSLIAKRMKEDLGIEVTRQAIAFYDPTRCSRPRCPKRWAALFWTLRAEFIAGMPDAGAAHPAVRVRRLDQMACDQMDKGNTAEARALLKQAADEMNRMTEEKDDGRETAHNQLSAAELLAEITEVAGELGYAVVPIGARAADDGEGAAEEAQPPGEPLSG